MSITRNTSGFSALPANHPLAGLDIGNPFKWATWMEDFLAYDITQAIGGNPWTLTQTNCVDTILGPNGVLTLTLGGADNDVGQMQLAESPFQLVAGKEMFFQARFKFTLATGTIAANELFLGLATEQTTTNFIAADGLSLAVDNCVGFVKYDAGAAFRSVARISDAESGEASVLTPADATWYTVAIHWNGVDLKFYQGTAADGSNMVLESTVTGNIPTAVLNPTIYVKAGEAKANVLSVDYVFVANQR